MESTRTRPATGRTVHRGMTELVIGGPFAWILEDFVGFLGLLEPLLRAGIIRVAVRVIFHGQTTVGLFQVLVAGTALYTQHLVIVAFGH